jgi:hypothetical protein
MNRDRQGMIRTWGQGDSQAQFQVPAQPLENEVSIFM